MSDFENLMNQIGYTGNGTGSVRDFFKESSYNNFDLIITLCGIYTAPQSESYYAGSDGTQNCQALARWAAQQVAADPNINFADYDSDNNGEVDGFHFIFAGRGQEAGGGSSTIWSHKWQFYPPVTKNGKSISVYSCSPELLYSNITTIGVICHEMTHAFGAPDFYDTNYEINGEYDGTGQWDIMASGSWNGNPGGNRPPHHNMYTKIQFGWVTPIVLSQPITVSNMPNSAQNPVAYRINTPTNNEYYLLENRQKVKFDTNVPGDGLLIYHVHSNVGTSCINCTHPQKMYPVCASSTTAIPASGDPVINYGNINSAGCPFPGTSNKTSFNGTSTPRMFRWTNTVISDKPITNITNTNQLVSFDFMGGGVTICPTVSNLSVDYAGDCSKAIINWSAPGKSRAITLWDNTNINYTSTGVTSSYWANLDTWTWCADDFTADAPWTIEKVYSKGFSATQSNPNGILPTKMAIAIYQDGGNKPGTEIYRNTNLSITDGSEPVITLPTPFTLPSAGKYWIAIAGAYNTHTANDAWCIYCGSTPIGSNWQITDPAGTFVELGAGWSDLVPLLDYEFYSMYFKLEGSISESFQYNVYRDGVKITSTPISATTFEDLTFNHTQSHTWSVETVCPGGGTSEWVNVQKNPCELPTLIITASAGANGTISPTGNVSVNYGANQTFNFYPNSGYHIDQVLVDGVNNSGAVSSGSFTFSNVTANHTISVTFANTFTITASSGGNGTISPNGNITLNFGANQTFTFTPNTGYHIDQVLVDNVNNPGAVSSGSYTFSNVTANHTISVTFAINTYTITASAGPNGTISPDGNVTVNHGANQIFTFTPNTGYHIETVLVDGVNNPGAVTSGSYSFTNVTANQTISVTFAINAYTITATADTNGNISPDGNVTVNHGGSQTFTFTPNTGYHIDQVLINNVNNPTAVTAGSYTFTNVTSNHSISVTFSNTYTIIASSGGNGTITPNGNISVIQGSNQIFTFEPNTGYHIDQVLVDNVNNPGAVSSGNYTFNNITTDHTIQVTFATNTYTITAVAGTNGTIDPSGNVAVNHGDFQTFTFKPNTGFQIANVLVDDVSNSSAITNGFYIFTNVTANHTIAATFAIIDNITENELDNIKVYSFLNSVYIENEMDVAIKSVEILDMYGRLIYQGFISGEKTVIPLQVAEGIYNVKLVLFEDTMVSKKVLIRK